MNEFFFGKKNKKFGESTNFNICDIIIEITEH